ncbi:unnamed protein product [Rotaria sp. Silwood1]|nr:unnamed protein product [Rotaria sp. Silwood1]CAF4795999.1 unnamed protein product [Rotaria sp. Silwood1]
MLTIKQRYSSLRQFSFEREFPLTEELESPSHILPLEPKPLTKPEKIDELDDKELLERINKLKDENETMRLENLLFSRYLLRVTKPKIIETFNDYEDKTDIIVGTFDQTKVIDTGREISYKISTTHTRDGKPLWIKRSVSSRTPTDIRYIPPIEQKRFFIASYEVEQTHLDWQRMKANALAALDNLKLLYRNIQSDYNSQQLLNQQLERQIDKYRTLIGEQEFNSPYLSVPGELFVSRVHKLIDSRISSIGAFLVNTELLHTHIERVDVRIRQLDDFMTGTNKVEIDWEIKKQNDYSTKFKNLENIYIIEKSSYYTVVHHLEEIKKDLNEQKLKIEDLEKQFEILQNYLEQKIIDINYIKQENNKILKENNILKDRIDTTLKVPTINNYAYITEKRKLLQNDINIWTQRVNIAETLLSQLKRQNKPPKILPPLQTTI